MQVEEEKNRDESSSGGGTPLPEIKKTIKPSTEVDRYDAVLQEMQANLDKVLAENVDDKDPHETSGRCSEAYRSGHKLLASSRLMSEEGIMDDIAPRAKQESHVTLPRLKQKKWIKRKKVKRELTTVADEVDEPNECTPEKE